MSDEIASLRAEISSLRRELDLVLNRLGSIGKIEPDNPHDHLGGEANYFRTASIAVIDQFGGSFVKIFASDDSAGINLWDASVRARHQKSTISRSETFGASF